MLGLETLTYDDVVQIHDALTRDFADSDDPISPPGIKDQGLLQSAVARQHAGYDGFYKYKTAEMNAATLAYGICCNHALNNGNKRTALVAMLCHLDRNNLTFNERATQDEMYSFMLRVAAHRFAPRKHKGDASDIEIEQMGRWIKSRTRKIQKSERIVTYRELERILKDFNIVFEKDDGNYVDLYRVEWRKLVKGLIFKREEFVEERVKICNIPHFKDARHVGRKLIRNIRKAANLMPEDGVDSDLFYGKETTMDEFIFKYKKTLARLART
ncbi:type II toxin-antitoxin system death-on-curing family toxin [Pseudomonas aeruginosa]|nr:type II toxin-antitoxin system death-on-curing family toxin [Pseudomonas aeruginosa]